MKRRELLFTTTAMVAVAGLGISAWPLIDQMNPDAAQRATQETLIWDVGALREGEQQLKSWRGWPISVAHRTSAMLQAMQSEAFVATLIDAASERRQQPAYARNWHRSIDQAFAVLIAICTSCRCKVNYVSETSQLEMAGGFICPCCATRYDPGGRAYSGLARFNLPVPPYDIVTPSRIVIGRNADHDLFSLNDVEAI
jgi:ubiquinol-cytochrome c reductase iron-sulfur subunit